MNISVYNLPSVITLAQVVPEHKGEPLPIPDDSTQIRLYFIFGAVLLVTIVIIITTKLRRRRHRYHLDR